MSAVLAYLALLAAPATQGQAARCDIPTGWVDSRDPEQLSRQARRGDREAQFQLGLRYELGLGRVKDLRKAKQMYDRAAAGPPKRRQVYSPAVPGERHGQIVSVENRSSELPHPRAALRSSCLVANYGLSK